MWRHASLVLAALAAPAGAQAQTVGSVTSANQQARGTPPGGAARPLSLGLGIVQNERIQTDAAGTAQISFNDRSTMSIGRSSTVVVNRHVYDPGSGTGAQATSLLRGALRYVGGDVSHGGNATVTTPVATLGVRGGVASIALEQQGGRQVLKVTNHYGQITIRNSAGVFTLSRADMQVIVDGPNALPRPAGFADPATMTLFDQGLASNPRQSGGARVKPSDAAMARQGVRSPRLGVEAPSIDLPAAADEATRKGVEGERRRVF